MARIYHENVERALFLTEEIARTSGDLSAMGRELKYLIKQMEEDLPLYDGDVLVGEFGGEISL